MKKSILLFLITFGLLLFGCYNPPDCEVYNEGDVTFHDNGPSWVWDGCYIEVSWADGSYNNVTFYGNKTFYNKPAGNAYVYMQWEDDIKYYWNYGYVNVIQCEKVDSYCTWNKKKSKTISEFILTKSGYTLKK